MLAINNFFSYITDLKENIVLSSKDWCNLFLMNLGFKEHYCFYLNSVYHLVIHGNEQENKVRYCDKLVSFAELPKLIRKEQVIPDDEQIVIKVYTCFGGNMPYYIDSKNLVVSAFANKVELNFEPFWFNNKLAYQFSYA